MFPSAVTDSAVPRHVAMIFQGRCLRRAVSRLLSCCSLAFKAHKSPLLWENVALAHSHLCLPEFSTSRGRQ